MRKILFAVILFLLAFVCNVFAQDTLPKISIKVFSGKAIVSWRNEYKATVTNINIQRSSDSIRNFSTIATVLNPLNEDNGFVDTKPPKTKTFYRVFIAFEGGTYTFSKSYRLPVAPAPMVNKNIIALTPPVKTPVVKVPMIKKDTVAIKKTPVLHIKNDVATVNNDVVTLNSDNIIRMRRISFSAVKIDPVKLKQLSLAAIDNVVYIRERAVIVINRDSRDVRRMHINIRRDSTDILSKLPFKASKYININRDNNVIINLPQFATKKYSIKFYPEKDNVVLFEINKITEPYLILEKVNFRHSGWFRYHLYSNGILVEKYKIFIAIDDKTAPSVKEKYDLTNGGK